MDGLLLVTLLFFLVILYYKYKLSSIQENDTIRTTTTTTTTTTPTPTTDSPGHVKTEHLLYDLLQQYSNGDKLYLAGQCNVNLYTKNIIDVDMKAQFTNLLNVTFRSIYGITQELFKVQELNNIYEQIDSSGNSRYIIDATLNAVNSYYTTKVILDIVILNNEVFVNYIDVNGASNNNIIDRYDVVFQDQGILFNHNNFSSNIRALLDTEYKKQHKLISIDSKNMDSKNYNMEHVLSLKSLLKQYLPSTLSTESEKNLKMKGLEGHMEMYFPPSIKGIDSPQFCEEQGKCTFGHSNTETEYNQPFMAPGLFFDRSSFRK